MNLKIAIFYFTGTGNNLRVAKGLKEALVHCDLYPFRYLRKNKSIDKSYTHVVFVVPAYYSHIPNFVKECMEGLCFADEQKVVTIIDCGGNRGRAAEDLRECVKACGKEVAGEYMVMHPGNYILSYNAFPKVYQKLVGSKAEKKIRKIAQAIKEDQLTTFKKTGIIYFEKFEPSLQASIAKFNETGKHYEVSKECIGCGICEKVCPVKNIHMENRKPAFGESCAQCMACIQWCPGQAIDYQGKAKKRNRYHHPRITVKEVIEANKFVEEEKQ